MLAILTTCTIATGLTAIIRKSRKWLAVTLMLMLWMDWTVEETEQIVK